MIYEKSKYVMGGSLSNDKNWVNIKLFEYIPFIGVLQNNIIWMHWNAKTYNMFYSSFKSLSFMSELFFRKGIGMHKGGHLI